jgi:hypothetical protein
MRMEEQIRAGNGYNTGTYENADPKSRMAEYIASYYGTDSTDVRSILNETKVGARRRQKLHSMLNIVFSKP